jgi:TctA family transporter
VGCAFVLRFLAGGSLRVRRSVIVQPTTFVGLGMLLAIGTALAPLVFGDALLESVIWQVEVPAVGTVKVVSSAFFDLGVYFLVVGVVLGQMIEKHFREGLYMSQGDLSVFWSSPIAIGIWSLIFLVVMLGGMSRMWKRVFPPGDDGEG